MKSPHVADLPPKADSPPLSAAALRVRAPFSRPRPPRPALASTRAVAISVAAHAILAIVLLLMPDSEPPVPVSATDGEPAEAVQFVDVSEWGGLAAGGDAGVPDAIPAPEISAGAMDSILDGTRAPLAYPQSTAFGIRGGVPAPGQRAGGGAAGRAQGAVPGTGTGTAGGSGQGAGGGNGRSPLSVEYGDERLVVSPGAIPERQMSREERYQRHFEAAINAMNDSVADEAERRRRLTDWTFTDRNGKKWGLDDRGPVVNGVHVPAPRPQMGRRSRELEDADRRERAQRGEIDRQSDQIDRDRNRRERGQATRDRENERRRREREQTPTTTTPAATP
jgi:hypothetical protein